MAKKEELEITISDTGEIKLEVIGGKGKKCMDMTKDLEEALGVVREVEKKSDYYQEDNDEKEDVVIKDRGENNG